MKEKLEQYKNELENEAKNILHYWMQHTIDNENGGFYGRLDNNNTVYTNAPKGSVLNSRILWTFSAAYNYSREQNYLDVAHRACNYIVDHFIDKEFALLITGLVPHQVITRRRGDHDPETNSIGSIIVYHFQKIG